MLSLGRVGTSGLIATVNALELQMETTAAGSKSGMSMAVPATLLMTALYTNHNALVSACVFMYICVRESLHVCARMY